MFRAAISLFTVIFVLAANISNAAAERRVALVIGNSDYKHTSQLRNPKHDANDLSVVLARMGFEVIDGTDLNKRDMEKRIRDFSNALEGADVGLFFYAGHGLQVNGKNFLAPIDAELKSESDLDFEAVELNLVLRQMERNARINLVFLDACRDNPLAQVLARSLNSRGRSAAIGRGLARVEKAVGMMISFATQPGNIALDGEGRNSPFTSALLKHIGTDGASINDVMIDVRNDVLESTDGKQVPWENSSLTGQFYFKPGDKAVQIAAADPAKSQASTTKSGADIDLAFWTSIRDSRNPALFEEYLRRFPDGAFTPIAKAKLSKTRAIDVEAATDKSAKTTSKKSDETGVKTAELTPSATATDATKSDTPAIDTQAAKLQLAKDVQTALKKVGCYTSSIDGIWGRGSQGAMQRFNSVAKMSLSVGEPDEKALTVIGAWRGKRCTIVAKKKTPRKTTSSRSAKKKAPQQQRRQQTTQRRQPPPQQDSGPPQGGGPSTTVIIGGGRRNGAGGLAIGILGGGIRF